MIEEESEAAEESLNEESRGNVRVKMHAVDHWMDGQRKKLLVVKKVSKLKEELERLMNLYRE